MPNNEIFIKERHNEGANNAIIYIQGPDWNGAFSSFNQLINKYLYEEGEFNALAINLPKSYDINSEEFDNTVRSFYERHESDKITLLLVMHGKIDGGKHLLFHHPVFQSGYTKDIIAHLVNLLGNKPIDIVLKSCSGALFVYEAELPYGSSFFSASDEDSSHKLYKNVLRKILENPSDNNYSTDHLLKVLLCVNSNYGQESDFEHSIRMVSSWGEVLDLREQEQYLVDNYKAIFTRKTVNLLHERFAEVEGTCGSIKEINARLDEVLKEMSEGTIDHSNFYARIAIVEETLEIYHDLGTDINNPESD